MLFLSFLQYPDFCFFELRKFSITTYKEQLRKRVNSLFVVFILISILSFVLCYTLSKTFPAFAQLQFVKERMDVVTQGLYGSVQILVGNPFAFQLWFVSQLFIMCLITPIIFILIRKLGSVVLVILGIMWALDINISVGFFNLFNCDAYLFFILGSFLAIKDIDFLGKKESIKNKSLAYGLLLTTLVLSVIYTIICATLSQPSFIQNIFYKLIQIVGVIAVWYGYDCVAGKWQDKHIFKVLAQNSFMIFLFHEPLQHIVFQSIFSYNSSDVLHVVVFFSLAIISIMFWAFAGEWTRNKIKPLHKIITGGR